MDTFMDKLAQKLTAQEMIKANMAADAEEMNKLKAKTKEYAECLEQMQKLVESGVDKINETQKATETQMNAEVQAVLEELKGMLAGQPEALESVKNLIADLETIISDKTDDLEDALNEKTGIVSESIHKECVKVYRNVQAVVVEENGKQTENIAATVNGLRGKLNAILGVSITALVLAVGSIVIQVLNLLNFKFF